MGAVRGRTAFCYLFFFPGGNSVLLTEHWFKSGNSLKKDLCRRESPSGNGEWRGGRRLVQAFVLVRARLFFLSLNLHVYPGMLWLIARNHLSSATVLYMYGSEWWLLWECILHKFRGTFLLFSIVLGLNLRTDPRPDPSMNYSSGLDSIWLEGERTDGVFCPFFKIPIIVTMREGVGGVCSPAKVHKWLLGVHSKGWCADAL